MSTASINNVEVAQLNRVVCIFTHLRAGSGLMSSLLDSHPNLLSTPDDILMGFYEFWDRYGHGPADQVVSDFLEYYAVLFDAWGVCMCPRVGRRVGDLLNWTELGADRNEKLSVDQDVFTRVMNDLIGTDNKVSRKLFFQAVHAAYAEALGWRVNDPQIVFGLHIPHAHLMQKFLEDFPEGKFLQMVRRPVAALGSHFRHYRSSGDLHPTAAAGMVARAVSGPTVPPETRSQWRGVRLEDLHQQPRETMQRVCDWLQIPWDETLVKSTVNGKQWWNEKSRPQVSGPNDVIPSDDHKDYLPAFDRFRLEVLAAKRSLADGYEVDAKHRWIVTRLLVLPLLAIPLKIELASLFAVRWGPHARGATEIEPKPAPIVHRVLEALHGLYLGRRVMLAAWLRLFKKPNTDLEMI